MKIISKFKDYYDYLQGIYGVDTKKILDRTKFTNRYDYDIDGYNHDLLYVFFCGRVFMKIKRHTWNDRIEPLLNGKYNSFYNLSDYIKAILNKEKDYVWIETNIIPDKQRFAYGIRKGWFEKYGATQPFTKHLTFDPYPNLQEVGFNKIMSPHDCYVQIDQYISYIEPEVPSDPTDMQRFEGKGFDKKSSFRH